MTYTGNSPWTNSPSGGGGGSQPTYYYGTSPWTSGQSSSSGGSGGGSTPPPPSDSGGSGPSQNALDILTNWFETYLGLGNSAEIVSIIQKAWQGGYSPADMDLFLPDIEKTHAFQTRFPGYQQAIKNGYLPGGVGGLGTYLQLEGQMRATLSHWGLPAGFYDSPSDFGQFIGGGVSPDELNNRAELAVTAARQIDPTMRNLMAKYYGLSTGDLASYFLDPNRALPAIERQYKTAEVASWASRYGLDVTSATRYEDLVDKGITGQQAAQGYGTVAALKDTVGQAGSVYGESYSQSDAENDVFFNKSDKRRRIMANETATFSGSSQGATGAAKRSSY